MYLPTNTTLAELHELKDTCLSCYTVDGCDNACPYWRFSVDDYVCAFEPLTQPIDWILPEIPIVED